MKISWQLLCYCCSPFIKKMTSFMERVVGLEMKEPNMRALDHGFVGKGQGERMCSGGNTAWCNARNLASKSGFKSHFYAFLVSDLGQVTCTPGAFFVK